MDIVLVQDWLIGKFREIEKRWLAAMEQLNEDQLHWRPNAHSNSIANLVVHIRGNASERISQGIYGEPGRRDRDAEFEEVSLSKEELIRLVQETIRLAVQAVEEMTEEKFAAGQVIRGKLRTNFDVLSACATHYSEHLGQVLYIAKQQLDEAYETTSIPLRKK